MNKLQIIEMANLPDLPTPLLDMVNRIRKITRKYSKRHSAYAALYPNGSVTLEKFII